MRQNGFDDTKSVLSKLKVAPGRFVGLCATCIYMMKLNLLFTPTLPSISRKFMAKAVRA
jgi:hypothetical protein